MEIVGQTYNLCVCYTAFSAFSFILAKEVVLILPLVELLMVEGLPATFETLSSGLTPSSTPIF